MDILIKNMEMPKSCEGCFACEEFSYECYDYCNILKAPTTRGERRKDCPLVALPPHGDLKDMADIWDTIHKFFHGDCFEVCKLIRKFCPTILEASNGTDN